MTKYKHLCIWGDWKLGVFARLIGDAIQLEATHGELLYGLQTHHESWMTVQPFLESDMDKELRKRVDALLSAPATAAGDVAAHDPVLEEEQPLLHAMLTTVKLPDGRKRQGSSLTLFCEDGKFKGFFNDKQNNRSFCLSANSLEELLTAIEAALASGDVPWRAQRDFNGKGGGRR